MTSANHMLSLMVKKFERRAALSEEERQALFDLPYEVHDFPAHAYLVREGERPRTAKLIVEGFAYRQKVTIEGARQIISVHIPGDFIDLEGSLLDIADHNVQALSPCKVAQFERPAIVRLIEQHGRIAHAMWIDTLIDASIYREWVVNVGRRDARQAMCHLLCEFGRRLEILGHSRSDGFEMPMTQEQLADALGITPVHVNRILRELDREGVVVRDKRFVHVPCFDKLKKIAGFNELYLHLDQAIMV